jgi:hypothetical protein
MSEQVINDYVLELPELKELCSQDKLLNLWDNLKEFSFKKDSIGEGHWDSDWDGQEFIRVEPSMFHKLNPENRKNMERLFSTINNDVMFDKPDGWMVIKYKHKWMRPHLDHERNSVLIIPIVPEEYPITYVENKDTGIRQANKDELEEQLDNGKWGNILYEHTYRMPTIINGKIPHTVFDYKQLERRFFQISLFFNSSDWNVKEDKGPKFWNELVDCYKKGNLINV